MMTWIALLLIVLALGAAVAVVSSRRVRTLRDELFEDALPSARTGESPEAEVPVEQAAAPVDDRGDWGLRWAEVTNLTPAGPERRPAAVPARSEPRDSTVARS